MEYPAYYDHSTRPVRQHPIPSYFEDPDEAPTYCMLVGLWEVQQEKSETRRRIVAALKAKAALQNAEARAIAP
jgi:hypothetical protein